MTNDSPSARKKTVTGHSPPEAGRNGTSTGDLANRPTGGSERVPKTSRSWKWQLGLSIFVLILIAVIGGVMGYQNKTLEIENVQATQAMMSVKVAALEQFSLGDQALEAEEYLQAKTHFEYVLQADPSFPDIDKKLAAALIGLYSQPTATATPTVTPTPDPQATPIITPTPEIPDQAELLYQAQDLMKNREWSLAIETLQTLRYYHPAYQSAAVDGLFFTALYNRGMALIEEGDLAGGIYDLERAGRFGTLGEEGQDQLKWASFYLAGRSYWRADWGKAAYYFGLIVEEAPNFQDASGITVEEHYREAAQEYAQRLAEQEDWCEAEHYFRIALAHGGGDNVELRAEEASQLCGGN